MGVKMTINWFELLLVVAGGVIGVAGSLITALVSNRFANKKARRDDLLAAYVEWSRAIHIYLYAGELLMIYIATEKAKKDHSGQYNNLPNSLSGMTREDHQQESLDSEAAFYGARARLLLLETRPWVRTRIKKLSDLQVDPGNKTREEIAKDYNRIRARVDKFIEEIAGERSGF